MNIEIIQSMQCNGYIPIVTTVANLVTVGLSADGGAFKEVQTMVTIPMYLLATGQNMMVASLPKVLTD